MTCIKICSPEGKKVERFIHEIHRRLNRRTARSHDDAIVRFARPNGRRVGQADRDATPDTGFLPCIRKGDLHESDGTGLRAGVPARRNGVQVLE
ncbi:hypothetical protein [Tabrizicola oligotrophica]|uniref:Uncharacterized protein n=1 Tax=Tabrizicola oligotrophica TaxID=2710650 RepID=A0A6M0QSI5_9RHOB|nr:hypothetical protein [Tabrizicola oligotrophica]NEY89814.1 hypothetical protein [Tabrizicola oligotrophica]